jgi:hypothetical protein
VRLRFQADADLKHAIVAGTLRREPGLDFQRAESVPLEGLADPTVLALAAQASALARNDHTLLAKSDPAPQTGEQAFAVRKRCFCRRASHAASRPRQHWRFDRHTMSSHKLSTLRASGADDGTAKRTP